MSPRAEGETVTRNTELTLEREREGRENACRRALMQNNAHCKRYCCLSRREHGILAHAHIKTPLTTTGTQALFVVNSVKLHLTAFNSCGFFTFQIAPLLMCTIIFRVTILDSRVISHVSV